MRHTRGPGGCPDCLRFFAGLTVEKAACVPGISTSTADNDWSYVRWGRRYVRLTRPSDPVDLGLHHPLSREIEQGKSAHAALVTERHAVQAVKRQDGSP